MSCITCSWTQKVLVLSFFHQVSPCDCLARPLCFPEYSKGEIRLKIFIRAVSQIQLFQFCGVLLFSPSEYSDGEWNIYIEYDNSY